MKTFLCQSPDNDGDDWRPVEAFDSEDAAIRYAEICDGDSAGEMFSDPLSDEHEIAVRDGDAEPQRFVVSFDFSKMFMAVPK